VPTVFSGFEDYWRPLLGGTGPAPSLLASLSERERADVRALLLRRLETSGGQSIRLTARAWAVAGRKS